MSWTSWMNKLRKKAKPLEEELLLEEIQKAKLEWDVAYHRLDVVVGMEQVDYAIYALEAAEKRYEMLIRQAKQKQLTNLIELGISKRPPTVPDGKEVAK
ncbi:YaaL family protein [Marinicrinis lubricantis]|uniref:YaaL family protein n=1 Tax=Marinicrinis lubricantis TaxID=2086470 RepID=A0ABW1IVD4_9BACL